MKKRQANQDKSEENINEEVQHSRNEENKIEDLPPDLKNETNLNILRNRIREE